MDNSLSSSSIWATRDHVTVFLSRRSKSQQKCRCWFVVDRSGLSLRVRSCRFSLFIYKLIMVCSSLTLLFLLFLFIPALSRCGRYSIYVSCIALALIERVEPAGLSAGIYTLQAREGLHIIYLCRLFILLLLLLSIRLVLHS